MVKVREYYRGRTVLLTGGTGLLGKVLLETLLRKLPDVARIYVLIRPRTDADGTRRSPSDRLHKEVLASTAFRHLRACHGAEFDDFIEERVQAVAGELTRERLGIDPAVYRCLQDEVDVVLHGGACAVFDAPLDLAVETNALGPQRILEFARGAPTVPFVAHVSTCYVNRLAGPIFETPLSPLETPEGEAVADPYDADEEVEAIRRRVARIREEAASALTTGRLRLRAALGGPGASGRQGRGRGAGASDGEPVERLRQEWIREQLVAEGMSWARRRGWRDTYTFTKALGEQLFARHRGGVPSLILRPSIIESSLRNPAPGWMDGFRMLDPLIVGFARGQLFEFPGNPESIVDVVPVDTVANALLASVPATHAEGDFRVYQVASGMENPLILKDFVQYLVEYFERTPLPRGAGGESRLPELTFPETDRFLRRLDRRHRLPLRVLEGAASLLRFTSRGERRWSRLRSRRLALERLRHYAYIYGPYAESQARFLSFNVRRLWESLYPEDRALFPFDVAELCWKRYVQEVHLPGIESHLLGIRPREGRPEPVAPPAPAVQASPADTSRRGSEEEALVRAPAGAESTAAAAEPRVGGPAVAAEDGVPVEEVGLHPGPGSAGRPDSEEAQAEGGPSPPVRRDGGWTKARRLLSVAGAAEAEVERWITPVHKKVLRHASFAVIRAICKHHLELECTGREHVPRRGPFIVVSNHTSHVDTGVLLAALGPLAFRVHPAAATDYWFRNPVLGWVLHGTLGAVPFDRNAQNVTRALGLPAEILRNGHSLIFYPEGGRSATGELRPFKSAIGLLALASAVPVLPVYIQGAYEALPKGDSIIKHHPVRVRFGPVIAIEPYLAQLDRESVAELSRNLADDVHGAVELLCSGDDPGAPPERSADGEAGSSR